MNSWLHQLPTYWHRRNALTYLLWPVEVIYRIGLLLRQSLFKGGMLAQHRVNATVIVVGNVVVGGGGKTPLTIAIVRHLVKQDIRVGVVSRGYGRTAQSLQVVSDQSDVKVVGDEPLLIHQKCHVPVVVGSDRVKAALLLLEKFPDVKVLVCDDGLQHLSLQRDLEICVMDATGIGNGHLLPAGPLREPWPRAVDLLLHTQTRTLPEGFESTRRLSPFALSQDGQATDLNALKAKPLEVVSGIAKPDGFLKMLADEGLMVQHATALPDHDNFENWQAKSPQLPLLCTEKDAVKLWAKYPHALAVPLIFEPEIAFWQEFDVLFRATRRYH